MDFTPTEAQQDLARLTGEVCEKLVTADRLRELDRAEVRFDEPLWRSLAETGVLAATLPESVGGSDLGALEQTAVLRELGRAVAAVPYLWSIVLGAGALARFGSAAHRELAAKAAAGEAILTVALAEERNWDPAHPVTTATDAGGWRLTGAKTIVPFAAQADRILVPATVSGSPAIFLVDPSDPSARVSEQQVVDRAPEAEVEFDRTPAELVGTAASGGEILAWLLERGWLGLAAQQLGTLERALDLVAEYGREREQFGRKIGGFQAVAQRLADGYIALQGLRLAVTQAAWRLAEGLPAAQEIHTAKFWAAEAGHHLAHTVVHVHGGVGIDRDHIVHNYFTAAKHHEFALGGATDHLRALGALLAQPH
ncbi:acyl-CoA/acyl-ACP dehydrogenase [Nocardia sp. CDC159]|uniref:Acyl-CoA/acyl-ACP dehydrogenase n=1 Tax=Nocardia pulmonis TaxID=2951408 RepID=A0A9X2E2V6_9NOCA|nr:MULTISPECIES: acyl-CoA dehydrogenase family protein [Nocardia]MCM6772909.1 acyl-CoA/acyl-ACP dehydrogenase [Nocardia pulmonis]MCM6785788.1 acyl-CoA/acyl-ACP dehydrogenase [Nocardia sp. CDC159]